MNKHNHVAFIIDGNGRWGQKKNKGRNFGHFNGVETVKKIVKKSFKIKIPIVTLYVFSTENWRRTKSEIKLVHYNQYRLIRLSDTSCLLQIIFSYFKLASI